MVFKAAAGPFLMVVYDDLLLALGSRVEPVNFLVKALLRLDIFNVRSTNLFTKTIRSDKDFCCVKFTTFMYSCASASLQCSFVFQERNVQMLHFEAVIEILIFSQSWNYPLFLHMVTIAIEIGAFYPQTMPRACVIHALFIGFFVRQYVVFDEFDIV